MSSQTIHPVKQLRGTLRVPGDKSISHRALILSGISDGQARVQGLLDSEDVGRTAAIMEALGVPIQRDDNGLTITGVGLHGLKESNAPLYCGNSGTTLRLISGLLAGQVFASRLTGDESLDQRPMGRVIEPLQEMGATLAETHESGRRIIVVSGSPLKGIQYASPVASAQVKSALLLAGLYADSMTRIDEPLASRDHTERMLESMGASIRFGSGWVELEPGQSLQAQDIQVPSDFSSAAFFMVAALIVPNSSICLEAVLLNPTRSGLLGLLQEMGGRIRVENERKVGGETVADVYVESSSLRGVECPPALIPSLIDEIPILAVAAACAEGSTRIWGAEELRVKETDRLKAVASELATLGVLVEEKPDGLIIEGGRQIKAGEVKSHGDHRMAMALTVAAAVASGPVRIADYACTAISYPGFIEDWLALSRPQS